jgi:hypothetical protein
MEEDFITGGEMIYFIIYIIFIPIAIKGITALLALMHEVEDSVDACLYILAILMAVSVAPIIAALYLIVLFIKWIVDKLNKDGSVKTINKVFVFIRDLGEARDDNR